MEIIAVIFIVLALLFLEIGIYQRYGMYHVSYQSHFLEKEKTEGETVQFIEVVENRKILPIPWLKAELTVSKWLDFPGGNSVVTGESRFAGTGSPDPAKPECTAYPPGKASCPADGCDKPWPESARRIQRRRCPKSGPSSIPEPEGWTCS